MHFLALEYSCTDIDTYVKFMYLVWSVIFMPLKIICKKWCNCINIVLLCTFKNNISMVVLFWKYVDNSYDTEFVVTTITNHWWLPLNCFGERRGNFTKLLLKGSSSVRNVWRKICVYPVLEKDKSQRLKSRGRKHGAASAAEPQGT